MLGGYGAKHLIGDVDAHQVFERRLLEEARPEQAEDAAPLQQVMELLAGVHFPEMFVPAGSQKHERRSQRARADPGDDLKVRALARPGPGVDQPCPIGPVGAAA